MPTYNPILPEKPKDRLEVFRFLNGMAVDGKEGIDGARTRTPLVKTFLIEHVSDKHGGQPKPPAEIWGRLRAEPQMIDEQFMALQGEVKGLAGRPAMTTVGYLEQFDQRFFAYYTIENSQQAKKRVTHWIQKAPDLDSTWFSAPLLQALWDHDISHRGDDRFTKLSFRHDSVFELSEDSAEEETQDSEKNQEDEGGKNGEEEDSVADYIEPERRRSRFMMGDRISRIRASLANLQDGYSPLNALAAVRFPSLHRQGSHDLYQNGQVTNRSDSFEDHRNTIRYLYRIYKGVLDTTESRAWKDVENTSLATGETLKGVPLIVEFKEKLSKSTFDCWIRLAFHKKNIFRLWGEPVRMGPTKVHVYGADRHLWQPINLEITESRMVAILPQGTCGNTFHRLVTNIQRFVCPKISAWIGSQRFEMMLEQVKTVQREEKQ